MMCVLAALPDWIQALAAVGIVVLTTWTLKVLRGYARDTKRLADDSASQTERAQMPFLAVARKDGDGPYVVANQGFGPAINVLYRGYRGVAENEGKSTGSLFSLAPGGHSHDFNLIGTTFQCGKALEIEYESLSGKKYRTVVTLAEGTMHTTFEKLGVP